MRQRARVDPAAVATSSSYGTSRQRTLGRDPRPQRVPCGIRSRRARGRPARAATSAAACATSPTTPSVDRLVRAERVGVEVDLDDRRRPGRSAGRAAVVHMFSAQPQPTTQVGAGDQLGGQRRGEPAGDVERPRVAGKSPLRHRRGGQQRAAPPRPASSDLGAARARAPRPAMNTGRRGAGEQRRPARATAVAAGRRQPARHGGRRRRSGRRPAACTSSGRLSRTVRRSAAAAPARAAPRRRPRDRPVRPARHRADRGGQGRPGRPGSWTAARWPPSRRPAPPAACGSSPPR